MAKVKRFEISLVCQQCDKPFVKVTTEFLAQRIKFCSPECKGLAAFKRRRPNVCAGPVLETFHATCLNCGESFEYQDYAGSKRRHFYCSRTCKNQVSARNLYLRKEAEDPGRAARLLAQKAEREAKKAEREAKKKVAPVGYYVPHGEMRPCFSLEDDPWKSGRLPPSVTENQCFS